MKRFALLLLLACGNSPETHDAGFLAGQSCTGDFTCNGDRSALFCEPTCTNSLACSLTPRRFVEYPCSGPLGCTANSSQTLTTCDQAGSPAATPCPEFFRGSGFCVSGSPTLRRCDPADGGPPLWRDHPCTNCRTLGDSIVCD